MMKLKRPVAALLAAVLLLGLLSGCHRENGVSFRVAMGSVPATLDPALAATDEEKTVVSHLFENLMKLQSDGSGGTTAVNGVARSYQCDTTAEGQETYTFKLRSSAAWSDGTKVTAQDFVYAWKRLVDPLTGSKNARILDMVAGYSAARTGEDALQVSAPDDETFVVALSGRCPYFIDSVCTAAATMPVQSAAAAQENWSMSPDTLVTNGPYTVASWENDTMLLQQTDGYHDARRLGPESISFRFTADAKTANSLFEKGDADFVLGLTDEAVAKKIDSWMPDYYPETSVVLLNQLSDLTSNENVRRAMGLVIDRNAIAELLGSRTHLAAEGLVTWGIRSTTGGQFRDFGSAVDNDSENYEKNCQTAQELMKEAGYTATKLKSLTPVIMLYESDGTADSLALLLQKTWKEKLGLSVTLKGVSSEEITQALERGEYTLAALRVTSDRNDATGFLNRWRMGEEDNYANFTSSAYDMLLRVAAVSASQEARDAYLEDAERLLIEKGNVIPMYCSTRSWSLSESFTGVFGDGLGRYFFTGVHKASK
ncbi:MAG: peptide ABC transporter substrate-binding protein [Oscillospiraceae bacterium]|nr:peptide ABC transporter substrate-binding protein [Oscillospiraceae bacterium]